MKSHGLPVAKRRKRCSGSKIRVSATTVKQLVLNLAVSPLDKSRGHFSQSQFASQLQISKGTVTTIITNTGLKCYRWIQCHKLTKRHRNAQDEKAKAFIDHFVDNDEWKNIWFSNEACFRLHFHMNRQNERVYHEVTIKTDIPEEDSLIPFDKLQPFLHCYTTVSWHGKSNLRFIEGFADNQSLCKKEGRKL